METNEISRFLVNEKSFIGVFALDKLPEKKIKLPASLIINNDVSSKKGEHLSRTTKIKNKIKMKTEQLQGNAQHKIQNPRQQGKYIPSKQAKKRKNLRGNQKCGKSTKIDN